MAQIILFMHVSLDGFVAGTEGEMDWITVDEEIFDYVGDRTNASDTALYGRKTWEMMDGYWPTAGSEPGASKHDIEHSAWYSKVEKIVMSKTRAGEKRPLTRFISDLNTEIPKIKKEKTRDILIFGSPGASHSLMADGLIDEFWLFTNPILLGKGIPLFKNVNHTTRLQLKETHTFSSGVICSHYSR